jgi:hypothetical protein
MTVSLDPTPEADNMPAGRLYRWVDLMAAIVLALATVGTSWSGYQSARWGDERAEHSAQSFVATVKAGTYSNLAAQRLGLHVSLFAEWVAATGAGNQPLADFIFARFPEPLKSAAIAWRATEPLVNSAAPATPFEMPEYVLPERVEAERWETVAEEQQVAANRANEFSDRYLLFTIIFASVLFFGGISGKFRWHTLDVGVLVLSALMLVGALAIMFSMPIR